MDRLQCTLLIYCLCTNLPAASALVTTEYFLLSLAPELLLTVTVLFLWLRRYFGTSFLLKYAPVHQKFSFVVYLRLFCIVNISMHELPPSVTHAF